MTAHEKGLATGGDTGTTLTQIIAPQPRTSRRNYERTGGTVPVSKVVRRLLARYRLDVDREVCDGR